MVLKLDKVDEQYLNGPVFTKIRTALLQRNKSGIEKYGKNIDNGVPPTGCWKLEVIEELLDMGQYLAREIVEQEKRINKLKVALRNAGGMCDL